MRRRPYELICALAVVVGISAWYVLRSREGLPAPGGLVGHSLGVVGFLLMLSTETFYTIRKRTHRFAWGQTSTWLRVHIFTGIVGPFLVLLHSAGKFNGLAGWLCLLIGVMVVSGFVGRYIYTAVPRTLDGVEVADRDLADQIGRLDRQLQGLGVNLRGTKALALASQVPQRGWALVLARPWIRWRSRRRLHRALQDLEPAARPHAEQLQGLLAERYRLQMQADSLAVTRRLLSLWHIFHVPLGGAVFMLAFIHIGAALYYATFLK